MILHERLTASGREVSLEVWARVWVVVVMAGNDVLEIDEYLDQQEALRAYARVK